MIGMLNFKHFIFLGSFFPTIAVAADILLGDDAKLSGEFQGIGEDGVMSVLSPFSEVPLKLDAGHLLKVDFGAVKEGVDLPDQRVFLVNGDVLPARIEHLDEKIMHVVSPFFGEIQIPREMVDSVQLGIVPERMIYNGTGKLSDWNVGQTDGRGWRLNNNVMTASGHGMISREFKLPDKYIIRFDYSWSEQPNFRLIFADPLKPEGKRVDRYYLQYGMMGLEIKREGAKNLQDTTIALLHRKPEHFSGKEISIEIRVDRTKGSLHLYVNGELEGRYKDSVPAIPQGSGIVLVSQSPGNNKQIVSNFQITEWDDRGDRHRSEERGEGTEDSLIGRYGERFGGQMEAVTDGDGSKVYRFKSDFQKEPILLPESEVSTVFFAAAKGSKDLESAEGLVIRLSGDGQLALKACEVGEETIKMIHPFLGVIELKREAVTMLERRAIPKAKRIESE